MIDAPILRCSPPLVRGIPVFFEILRFASEMPKARFQEKLTPGIFIVKGFKDRGRKEHYGLAKRSVSP